MKTNLIILIAILVTLAGIDLWNLRDAEKMKRLAVAHSCAIFDSETAEFKWNVVALGRSVNPPTSPVTEVK